MLILNANVFLNILFKNKTRCKICFRDIYQKSVEDFRIFQAW